MIQVKVLTASGIKAKSVDADKTVRQFLEENEDTATYITRAISIDGVPLGLGDMDKSFREHGITEKCTLSAIEKQVAA